MKTFTIGYSDSNGIKYEVQLEAGNRREALSVAFSSIQALREDPMAYRYIILETWKS